MAQKKKTPPPSSSNSIPGDIARVLGAALYGVVMSLALAYLPVYLLLSASYGTTSDGSSTEPIDNGQPVAQAATFTPMPECDGAVNWWSAGRTYYDSFAASMSELFSGVFDVASVTADLRSQRDTFAAAQYPDCIAAARAELLAGMDETIAAFEESDPTTSEQRFLAGKDRFAAGINLLWALDVATDPTSAPSLDMPQGGGANCDAQAWYDNGRTQRESFLNAFGSIDVSMTREQWQAFIREQRGVHDEYAALETPECAAAARQHFINLMDAILSAYEHAIDAEIDATFADYERLSYELQFYTNWKHWLGIDTPASDY
ncbi:MAG: hypothetical protein U0694_06705 [Anaerolineae bacterium]